MTDWEKSIREKVYASGILTNGEWVYLVGTFQAAKELDGVALEKLERNMAEWQPIETAPKDGSRILAFGEIGLQGKDVVGVVRWNGSQWDANDDPDQGPWSCDILYWMSLPSSPLDHP